MKNIQTRKETNFNDFSKVSPQKDEIKIILKQSILFSFLKIKFTKNYL
ncbi:hypothetical protein B488_03800 [Liberibacter crescens BT-1]|uniref:Uncharacterized protein n=1 Tax=Liberibacter crescens (strain BT-1) TaxID=1215343 RepID=L0ETS8_LIBCB|nr:hypothetical protein B488_03800 [Liberibacter crescens BT-1]